MPAPALPGVLFLAYNYPPDTAIGGVRPARMAKYLERLGHTVTVVSRDLDSVDDTGVRVVPQASVKPLSFGQSAATLGLRLLQRVLPQNERLNWLAPAVAASAGLLEAGRAAVIISTSPPLVPHLAALYLKKKFNLKWVADFRDPFFGNTSRLAPFTHRLDGEIERRIFSAADFLIANTVEVAKEWKVRYPQHQAKMATIPNGYDPEEQFDTLPAGPRPYRVISHVGTIYAGRDPSPILAAAARLASSSALRLSELQIRLIGPAQKDSIERSDLVASLTAAGALHFTGQAVPKEEAQRETLSADCLLLLDSLSGTQVPGKLFEYIRIGRPILAVTVRNSAMDRILRDAGIPCFCIYPDTPNEEVDREILALIRTPVTRSTPSDSFLRQFDGAAQARQLSEIIQRLS